MGYAGKGEVVRMASCVYRSPLMWTTRDAWAKHKDLDPYEAKWLYVEALLKVRSRSRCYTPPLDNSFRYCGGIPTKPWRWT